MPLYLKPSSREIEERPSGLQGHQRCASESLRCRARPQGDDLASESARTSKDRERRAAALSYFPGRSGDIIIIPKENWLLAASVTTHGTLYP